MNQKAFQNKNFLGHITALITIFIWSLTFVQTKVLLSYLNPIEILIIRFFLAWSVFFLLVPKLIFYTFKEEVLIFLLGASGIFGYYVLENLALKYTSAINVGLIVTSSPVFTAFFIYLKNKDKKIKFNILGVIIVLIGLFILEYKNLSEVNTGDILALLGAVSFAFYSYLLSLLKNKNHLIITRKSFFWGLILLLVFFYLKNLSFHFEYYKYPQVYANLAILAFFASFLCFIMWKYAVSIIGATKTSNYIYLVPIINTAAAVVILNENFYFTTLTAMILIVLGLIVSHKYGI